MLRKLYVLPVLALFLLPAIARAQYEQGNWDLNLTGSGQTADPSFRGSTTSVTAGLGYLLTKELEVEVRQGINYTQVFKGGHAWGASTVGALDYHFDMDRLQPFVGVNGGYVYGDPSPDAWVGGPEAGIKWFANSSTYIYAQAAYEFNLQERISNGNWVYSAGIGFTWK
jgi:hypothetical protein